MDRQKMPPTNGDDSLSTQKSEEKENNQRSDVEQDTIPISLQILAHTMVNESIEGFTIGLQRSIANPLIERVTQLRTVDERDSSSEQNSDDNSSVDDQGHQDEFPFDNTFPTSHTWLTQGSDPLRENWCASSTLFKLIFEIVKNTNLSTLKSGILIKNIFNQIFLEANDGSDDEGKPFTSFIDGLRQMYANVDNRFGFCQKIFNEGTDYSYQCFDCFGEGDESRKIICEYCFDHGNHKGHQTSRCNSGGVCDCGTFNPVETPHANCNLHNGFIPENRVLKQTDIDRIHLSFQSVIFGFFTFIEEVTKMDGMLFLERLLINEFVTPLNKILKSYSSMIPIVANVMMTPLRDLVKGQDLPIQFLHDHDEVTHEYSEVSRSKENRSDCGCSAIELVFRFAHKFSVKQQTALRDLLLILGAYRPFKQQLAVCWIKYYSRIVRTKIYFSTNPEIEDVDEAAHSPLCELRNELLQDSKLLEEIVMLVDTSIIFRHLARLSAEFIKDPEKVLLPISPCWSAYSINDMVILSKSSKLPIIMRDSFSHFASTMYSTLFEIFKKVQNQKKNLSKYERKITQHDEILVSQMKYQYSVIDLIHEQFSSMIACERKDLCYSDIKKVIELLTNAWESSDIDSLKSFECNGPRILTVMYTGLLFLQTNRVDCVTIKNVSEQDLQKLNSEVIGEQVNIELLWTRVMRTVTSAIGMVHFIKRDGWIPFKRVSEDINERYDGLEFDLYDISTLQYCCSIVEQPILNILVCSYFSMTIPRDALIVGSSEKHSTEDWPKYIETVIEPTINYSKIFVNKNDGDDSKLAHMITEYFNLLTALFTEDLAIVAVLSEYSVVRNIAVKRGIKQQVDKFYKPSMKREFLNTMLASNPIRCEEFTKFGMVGLNHDDALKESLVEEFCDVNLEDRIISLKPKFLEQALKQFDMNSLNFRESHKELTNKWTENVDKQYHDKLSIKKQYDCELVRMSRRKLARTDPLDVVGMIKCVFSISSHWKKVQGPLSSTLRFVLVYIDCLQESSPDAKADFEKLMDELIPFLDVEVKGSPVYKSFKGKLNEYRKKFSWDQARLNRNISMALSLQDMNIESAEAKNLEKVRQLYETKKETLFAKLKSKQAQFFTRLDEATAKYVKEFNTDTSSDSLLCSVTKEHLTNSETYFIFAHMTESNLMKQTSLNTIKAMRQQVYLDSESSDRLMKIEGLLKQNSTYIHEEILLQTCGHLLKDEDRLIIGDPDSGYLINEYACPICKNASNCVLPIFSESILKVLSDDEIFIMQTHAEDGNLTYWLELKPEGSYIDWSLHPKAVQPANECLSIAQKLRVRFVTNLEARASYLEEINVFKCQQNIISQQIIFAQQACELSILSSMLRYTEIIGFAAAIESYPQLMNCLILCFRGLVINKKQDIDLVRQAFVKDLESLISPNLETNLRKVMSSLLVYSNVLPVTINSRENLFRQVVQLGIDAIIIIYIDKQKIESTQLTWESIRYDPEYLHVTNPILRFLRMASLMHYAYIHQSHAKSKKLMERIIQYNLNGDDKELEYHIVFLGVNPPNISKSAEKVNHIWGFMAVDKDMKVELIVPAETRGVLKVLNQNTMNFSLFKFGKTLRDALEIFFHNSCILCKRRTEKASVCLLCGELICAMECGFKGNDTEFAETQKQGQLTKHSMTHHKGKSVFLNCESLYFLFYDDTRKIIFDCMYLNRFGRVAETDKLKEFPKKPESFIVNAKKLGEIYNLLVSHRGLEWIMRRSFIEDLDPRGNEL